jgi:hypothetical protein
VILVRFAIIPAHARPESRLPGKHEGSVPEWRWEVLWSGMIISDDFSASCQIAETMGIRRSAVSGPHARVEKQSC